MNLRDLRKSFSISWERLWYWAHFLRKVEDLILKGDRLNGNQCWGWANQSNGGSLMKHFRLHEAEHGGCYIHYHSATTCCKQLWVEAKFQLDGSTDVSVWWISGWRSVRSFDKLLRDLWHIQVKWGVWRCHFPLTFSLSSARKDQAMAKFLALRVDHHMVIIS